MQVQALENWQAALTSDDDSARLLRVDFSLTSWARSDAADRALGPLNAVATHQLKHLRTIKSALDSTDAEALEELPSERGTGEDPSLGSKPDHSRFLRFECPSFNVRQVGRRRAACYAEHAASPGGGRPVKGAQAPRLHPRERHRGLGRCLRPTTSTWSRPRPQSTTSSASTLSRTSKPQAGPEYTEHRDEMAPGVRRDAADAVRARWPQTTAKSPRPRRARARGKRR